MRRTAPHFRIEVPPSDILSSSGSLLLLVWSQRVAFVIVHLESQFGHLICARSNLASPPLFHVPFPSRTVLRWAWLQLFLHRLFLPVWDQPRVIPLCGCHLAIRFSSPTSLSMSSSSPTMIIFVSNFFCRLLHTHPGSDLLPDGTNSSPCTSVLMSLCPFQNTHKNTLPCQNPKVLHCSRHLQIHTNIGSLDLVLVFNLLSSASLSFLIRPLHPLHCYLHPAVAL